MILRTRSFFFLSVLFFITRFILILWPIEQVSHYEGLQQGYIAMELLSGARAPWHAYQVDSYTSGTLWMGLLAVPFFIFLGPSLFTLKMLALVLSYGTFSLLYYTLTKFISRRTAIIAALLWIFSAPLLSYMSLMALGSHERLLPALLILFFTLQCATNPQKHRSWAGLGLAYGLAITTSYLNGILVLASLLSLKLNLKNFLSQAAAFAGGLLSGLCLWLIYNSFHSWAGLDFLMNAGLQETPSDPIEFTRFCALEFKKFLFDYLPNSPGFSVSRFISADLLNLAIFSLLFFLITADWIISFFKTTILSSCEKTLLNIIRFYLILFPIFHLLSKYKCYALEPGPFNFRYYTPLYALCLIYASILLVRKPSGKIVLAVFLALCLTGHAQTVWGNPFGRVFDYPGYKTGLRYYIWQHPPILNFESLADFDRQAALHFTEKTFQRPSQFFSRAANQSIFWNLGNSEEITASILKIPNNNLRRYFFRRWPAQLDAEYGPAGLKTLLETTRFIPEPYRRDFYFGAGKRMNFAEWPSTSIVLSAIESIPEQDQEIFYLTWGASLFRLVRNGYAHENYFIKQLKFIEPLEEDHKIWIYRGFGTSIYRKFQASKVIALHLRFLKRHVSDAYTKEFFWGIGWYLAKRYHFNPRRAVTQINALPPDERAFVREGFREFYRNDSETLKLLQEPKSGEKDI